MELKERVKHFLEDCGGTKVAFCKKIGISTTYYREWQNGTYDISKTIKDRITAYLDEVYKK